MGQDRWRIRELRDGRRRQSIDELQAAFICLFCALLWFVGSVGVAVFGGVSGFGDLVGIVCGGSVSLAGTIAAGAWVRSSLRASRPRVDTVWFDDDDLWWHRLHPQEPEPTRVTRSDIVEVRLGDPDGVVVVRTVEGVEHAVTDLGTRAERAALATSIADLIGPGIARIHPEHPPEVPARWETARKSGSTLNWRRPVPGRPWLIVILAYLVVGAGPVFVSALPDGWRVPAIVVVVGALVGLVRWLFHEVRPTGRGWLVRVGRLDAVRVRARHGDAVGTPCRVVALHLRRRPGIGCVRLHAVLEDGRRRKIVAGWRDRRRITAFAEWLAGRADLPLTRNTVALIG